MALFVNPEDGGDVDDVVELSEAVVGVDQAGVGGLGELDPLTGGLGVMLDGDGNDDEAVVLEFLVDGLPPGQVMAAASPRGVGGEEDLLTSVVGERVEGAIEVREGEVGGAEKGEFLCPVSGGDAEVGGTFGGVDGVRAADEVGEADEIDASVSDEVGVCWHRVADGAEAKAFGLELPGEGALNIGGGDADAVVLDGGLHLGRGAVIDDGECGHRGASSGVRGAWEQRRRRMDVTCSRRGEAGRTIMWSRPGCGRPVCLPVIVSPGWVISGPEL